MPRIHTIDCELIASAPLDEVFRFFEDPGNLARITPPAMGFEIVSTDRNMRRGLAIEYRVRVFGLTLPWKSLISEYGPPDMFMDEAVVSPYRLWRHRHTFRETGEGVVVADHVDYALPFYPLGEIAHPMVKRQLTEIFTFRQKAMAQYLGKIVETKPPVIR
jgi:ligand-binding SRPBCC domain-containing protein